MTARQECDTAANDATGPKRLRSAGDLRAGAHALLLALLDGPVTREQADRIAGASNGPDVVHGLRCDGIGIGTEWRQGVNKFDKPVRFGVYSLTAAGRTLATAMFRLQSDELAERQTRPPANDAQA